MESSTSSCLRNVEKLGTMKATEKRRSRDPVEIWITLLAATVDRKATILVTVNTPIKPSLKRMWKHSERQNRKNMPTSPLAEETKKRW